MVMLEDVLNIGHALSRRDRMLMMGRPLTAPSNNNNSDRSRSGGGSIAKGFIAQPEGSLMRRSTWMDDVQRQALSSPAISGWPVPTLPARGIRSFSRTFLSPHCS